MTGFGGGGLRPEASPLRSTRLSPLPDLPPIPDSTMTERRPYRSAVVPGTLVRIAAVATGATAAALAIYLNSVSDVVGRARLDPLSVYQQDLMTLSRNGDRVALALLGIQALTTVLLMVWLRRMYRTLTTLGVDATRFAPGWAVGAWIVPFLNFVRPKQMIDEVWRGCDPDAPHTFAASRAAPVPRTLHFWWGFWVLASVLAVVAGSPNSGDSLGDFEDFVETSLAGAVATAVSALLLERVAARLTMRHHERAVRLELAPPLARPWVTSVRQDGAVRASRLAASLIPTAVVLATLGVGAWTIEATLEGETGLTGDAAEIRMIDELRVGDCFDIPPGEYVLIVPIVDCDEAHDAEFLLRVGLSVGTVPYPGLDALIDRVSTDCIPAFDEYVGMRYEDSSLDVYWLYPDEAGWAGGNRAIECVLVSVDGSKLTGSMRGAAR